MIIIPGLIFFKENILLYTLTINFPLIILTTMVVNIIEKLKNLGFSEYESRAYIGLLESHPATAYELAKNSGLPTSKIYEVLSRLLEKNMVLEMIENNKKRYIPLEPQEFLENYQQMMDDTIGSLRSQLPLISKESNVSYIWNIRNYNDLMDKAARSIQKAKHTLLCSTWRRELAGLIGYLEERAKKNVKIALVHFGKPDKQVGQVYLHPIEDTLYQEKGGRGFTLVVDNKEAFVATINENKQVEGAWSRNNGFVTLAEDYIKHDIYIMKIVQRFDQDLIRRFGKKYHLLRDIFKNKEVSK